MTLKTIETLPRHGSGFKESRQEAINLALVTRVVPLESEFPQPLVCLHLENGEQITAVGSVADFAPPPAPRGHLAANLQLGHDSAIKIHTPGYMAATLANPLLIVQTPFIEQVMQRIAAADDDDEAPEIPPTRQAVYAAIEEERQPGIRADDSPISVQAYIRGAQEELSRAARLWAAQHDAAGLRALLYVAVCCSAALEQHGIPPRDPAQESDRYMPVHHRPSTVPTEAPHA